MWFVASTLPPLSLDVLNTLFHLGRGVFLVVSMNELVLLAVHGSRASSHRMFESVQDSGMPQSTRLSVYIEMSCMCTNITFIYCCYILESIDYNDLFIYLSFF